MPPCAIDYQKNCIYKLVCKDDTITDVYVGRTCDPIRKKYNHKINCKKNNAYVYEFIRNNGGWENWEFQIIEQYPCENSAEATDRETYWINALFASLNDNCASNDDVMDYKKEWYLKNKEKIKHKKQLNAQNVSHENKMYKCNGCDKQYKDNSGLWRHSKKCQPNKKQEETNDENSNKTLTDAIMEMMKQNQQIQKQLLEIVKEGHVVNNNTTNNNTTNNNFNLNVFLNETCKDALNMVDFVNSLHLQLTDLEETGKLGHSDGISRIFVNGLKVLDVNKRPIHCSDLKREVLYIKEGNVWEKDNDDKTLIKRAISKVESKNINQIPLWVKAHPECAIGSNRENTKYLKMVIQCTGGDNCDSNGNINKIIKNIAKEVVIDKLK
jgi:hypothetical protein